VEPAPTYATQTHATAGTNEANSELTAVSPHTRAHHGTFLRCARSREPEHAPRPFRARFDGRGVCEALAPGRLTRSHCPSGSRQRGNCRVRAFPPPGERCCRGDTSRTRSPARACRPLASWASGWTPIRRSATRSSGAMRPIRRPRSALPRDARWIRGRPWLRLRRSRASRQPMRGD